MELFNKALAIHHEIFALNIAKDLLLANLEEDLLEHKWQQFYPCLWISPELAIFLRGDEIVFQSILKDTLTKTNPWYGCIISTSTNK